jgi:hypothetical protein
MQDKLVIDPLKILTTKDKVGDIYIAVPAARSTGKKLAFAVVSTKMKMHSRFEKDTISFLFGARKQVQSKNTKRQETFLRCYLPPA